MEVILSTLAGLQRREDRQHSKVPTKGLPGDIFTPSPSLGPEPLWAPPTLLGSLADGGYETMPPSSQPCCSVSFFSESQFESQMVPHTPASTRLPTSTLQFVLKKQKQTD